MNPRGTLSGAPSSTGLRARLHDASIIDLPRGDSQAVLAAWGCEEAQCFSDPEDGCPCGRFFIEEDTCEVVVRNGEAYAKDDDRVRFGNAVNCRQTAALLLRAAAEMESKP